MTLAASSSDRAEGRDLVPRADVARLLSSAALADRKALAAFADGQRLHAALWHDGTRRSRLSPGLAMIDADISLGEPDGARRFKIGHPVLRDMLRLLAIRCLCYFPDARRPKPGQAAPATFPVTYDGSVSVLHAVRRNPGYRYPATVETWLREQGFDDAAAALVDAFR